MTQHHDVDEHFDQRLIAAARDALEHREPVVISLPIRNIDRAVGTLLGHEVTKRFGSQGLPPETIDVTVTGAAGQSLGAFLPPGMTLRLIGDANDYVGKGLSGGVIVLRPHPDSGEPASGNVIAGNVIGYGATSGELWIAGVVGERFMVRGSGAIAVVEGTGDHALEYFTRGFALILGPTGRNIGAGMSGGEAVILDLDPLAVNAAEMSSGALTLQPLAPHVRERVLDLLVRHQEQTGSAVAQELLDALAGDTAAAEHAWARFTHLIPRNYARVLEIHAVAHSEGRDPNDDQVWTQILEVTRG